MADNNLPATGQKSRSGYSPAQTAEIRSNQIKAVIESQKEMLKKRNNGINLQDFEAAQQAANEYMEMCSETNVYPNFEGLCAAFGLSRTWVYKFISKYPEHETAKYLDRLRNTWLSGKFSLSEKGILDSASVIFQAKNSMLGFSDRHELDIVAPLPEDERARRPEWAQALSNTDYQQKLLDSIPADCDIE